MQETKSNWSVVADHMKGVDAITLGKYASYWYYKTPRRMLHSLSYYKFAAKLIGSGKKVLDVGCNEGLGTSVLAKECGFAKGVDFDQDAIRAANNNFKTSICDFEELDILTTPLKEEWDAIVNFDVIEHIYPENSDSFFMALKAGLKKPGVFVLGTPSLISQQFASPVSKKGHVNIYSPERLESEMRQHFDFVFMFAANDEVVHTGYLPLAHYLITVGCNKA